MPKQKISWRDATPDDVGRLGRFRNSLDEYWLYGKLEDVETHESVFVMIRHEYDMREFDDLSCFFFCQVQEVSHEVDRD